MKALQIKRLICCWSVYNLDKCSFLSTHFAWPIRFAWRYCRSKSEAFAWCRRVGSKSVLSKHGDYFCLLVYRKWCLHVAGCDACLVGACVCWGPRCCLLHACVDGACGTSNCSNCMYAIHCRYRVSYLHKSKHVLKKTYHIVVGSQRMCMCSRCWYTLTTPRISSPFSINLHPHPFPIPLPSPVRRQGAVSLLRLEVSVGYFKPSSVFFRAMFSRR